MQPHRTIHVELDATERREWREGNSSIFEKSSQFFGLVSIELLNLNNVLNLQHVDAQEKG